MTDLTRAARRRAGRLVSARLGRRFPHTLGPGRHQQLVQQFVPSEDMVLREDGSIPLVWWDNHVNFGDLLSPWLLAKMTGRKVSLAEPGERAYVAVGSILGRATDESIVWGTGSFGTEAGGRVSKNARYTAVRGPLTRAKVLHYKGTCPAVYGDPALLAPLYYLPKITPTYEVGVIVRWAERSWAEAEVGPGVRVIDYGSGDIERIIDEMLSCKRIVTSSLHGLIVSDAYGIPSAWLASGTPRGGEFKFHDYFASVKKHRYPVKFDPAAQPLTVDVLRKAFRFDARPITFDYKKLLTAAPFMRPRARA
ncbi:polysaccharide pyruvyl transferase family protein [Cellulomonas edaphi]|uniref:Polysaccharide pyruvyl transferase family protein n=1 Tax=Cellulomonas edaphi TaxID=3053468 RepID=A0ABT7S609_9CELL|nr:polysaccharide pyruvyl transferase family protein [Cellulomons edaphi]MDM7831055.1 polysaccharide pyruvyl transferase family protein [Cellulomons edaphi]